MKNTASYTIQYELLYMNNAANYTILFSRNGERGYRWKTMQAIYLLGVARNGIILQDTLSSMSGYGWDNAFKVEGS